VRYDDVTDGASHTLYIGEKLPDAWDQHWLSGTRSTLRNTGLPVSAWTYGRSGLPEPGEATEGVQLPLDDLTVDPSAAAAPAAPADPASAAAAPAAPKYPPGNPLFVGGFGSNHPGGALFARGDGGVTYISNNMTPALLQQLAHRKDGLLPSRDW